MGPKSKDARSLVDRVVINAAFSEPTRYYSFDSGLPQLTEGRRPSMRYLASGKSLDKQQREQLKAQTRLFSSGIEQNRFINELRGELREWRGSGYPGCARVTRRLLEWWFERDEERQSSGPRLFFCQREAIEAVIYLYEAKNRTKLDNPEDALRYALKLATGTGKTVVMALLIVWSTLHSAKVSGSSLSRNFLVLAPNLTVRDRLRDSLLPHGEEGGRSYYEEFDLVPPEYRELFQPKVMIRNWQSISLVPKRDDWISDTVPDGGLIPASVFSAMRRRTRARGPERVISRVIENARDIVIINDEAHHVYGDKKTSGDAEPDVIVWNRIIAAVQSASRLALIADFSATPWYGSGSDKPEGKLYEWVVSDFSVFDAFESGLVKIVRLPDVEQLEYASVFLDLWEAVSKTKTEQEYLSATRGAIEHLYGSWERAFSEWEELPEGQRGPSPVILVVTDTAKRAGWIFDYISRELPRLQNPASDDPLDWLTIQVNTTVFSAEKGREETLREMVNTIGRPGDAGERVRCIVSVNMLSEGWDVKSITHILGLRAFGSPLLTEQVIGRGLRRVSYDDLGAVETVDAFGIPFVGFPIERAARKSTVNWQQESHFIEPDPGKARFAVRVPNIQSWAAHRIGSAVEDIDVDQLDKVTIDPTKVPERIGLNDILGAGLSGETSLDVFRRDRPVRWTVMSMAASITRALESPIPGTEVTTGPLFEEVLTVVERYVQRRVDPGARPIDDLGVPYYRNQAQNILMNAIQEAVEGGESSSSATVAILSKPPYYDSGDIKRFTWTADVSEGKRCHLNLVPCHGGLEKEFAEWLDGVPDVLRYVKNERMGFSIPYYDSGRVRHYYPDFIVVTTDVAGDRYWVCEPKGVADATAYLKAQAARDWCEKVSSSRTHGQWDYLFVRDVDFRGLHAVEQKSTFTEFAEGLLARLAEEQVVWLSGPARGDELAAEQ